MPDQEGSGQRSDYLFVLTGQLSGAKTLIFVQRLIERGTSLEWDLDEESLRVAFYPGDGAGI